MSETITVSIPTSAIDAAMRERIVSLEDERDAALAVVGPLDGETLAEAVSRIRFHRIAELTRERDEAKSRMFALTTERDEEKARRLEADRELELARVEAEAKPNQSAWEAACMLRKERDEARAELTGLQDVNVAVRSIVGIGNGESLMTAVSRLVDRLRGLESAIRTLGSVRP